MTVEINTNEITSFIKNVSELNSLVVLQKIIIFGFIVFIYCGIIISFFTFIKITIKQDD